MRRSITTALAILLATALVSCGPGGGQTQTADMPSTTIERTPPAPATPLDKGEVFLAGNRSNEGVVVSYRPLPRHAHRRDRIR